MNVTGNFFKSAWYLIILFSSTSVALSATPTPTPTSTTTTTTTTPYNIILIINDQETYHLLPAVDYQLPARQQLAKHGVTFTNHYTAAAMCSPSRATLLTGLPPQKNGVFDQMEYSYVSTLSTKLPNMGSVMKQLGYRTAYFGKFEMDKTLLESKPTVNYSTLAQPYGFDTFNYNGDVGGSPLQGYRVDSFFVGEAIQWLRSLAVEKEVHKQPFFLVLSLLNPHDIMYGDANLPGTPQSQLAQSPVIMPPPANAIYARNWQFTLPGSLNESLTASGMPNAYAEYQYGWAGALGHIPVARKDMWNYYYNYYLNALRDNDKTLQQFIASIDEMDLWKNTVIILTADHGEMGGAHGGLRGKGPMAYEQNVHVPLIIAHPQAVQGSENVALTSHIDMLPTLAGLTGLPESQYHALVSQLPGQDFSKLITGKLPNDLHAIRPAILFNYVGISTIDGNYLLNTLIASFSQHTLPSLTQVNVNKRGFISLVFDGRYKYARFFAPSAFNTPQTLQAIFHYNDVQLFDLQNDPDEMHNLALDKDKNKELILRMNTLLNTLLSKEVTNNNGNFLPAILQSKVKTVTTP